MLPDPPTARRRLSGANLHRATELPFAGHPTLGTCHAWLEAGGVPRSERLDHPAVPRPAWSDPAGGGLLGFAAPPLLRSGPVDEPLSEKIAGQLELPRSGIVDAQWADNGPGWVAVLLGSADAVLALRPAVSGLDVGVVGPYPPGAECAFEVRAFFRQGDDTAEDPVTGSLNASLGQWLTSTGRATAPYIASQGTVIGRGGRVHIWPSDDGGIWVGGATSTRITGTLDL